MDIPPEHQTFFHQSVHCKGIFFPSWRLLSDNGKKLLISMAYFAPGVGGTLEAVKATSDPDDGVLTRSIDDLWRLS